MESFPINQGEVGRHKCVACTYKQEYQDGLNHKKINLRSILGNLEESQVKRQQHKSPHDGYVKGYYDGIVDSYNE